MSKTVLSIILAFWFLFVGIIMFSPLLVAYTPMIIDGFTWIHGTLILLTVLILYSVVIYNRFVSYSNSLVQSTAGIDVQLKRRSDLIPNLVAVVQGYAKHEKTLLTTVATLRARMLGAQTTAQKNVINNQLSTSLKSVFAIAEQYPKLQANDQFLQLQRELTNTENEIAAARRIYNENVALYNTLRESFPSMIIGSVFGFVKSQYTPLV